MRLGQNHDFKDKGNAKKDMDQSSIQNVHSAWAQQKKWTHWSNKPKTQTLINKAHIINIIKHQQPSKTV